MMARHKFQQGHLQAIIIMHGSSKTKTMFIIIINPSIFQGANEKFLFGGFEYYNGRAGNEYGLLVAAAGCSC